MTEHSRPRQYPHSQPPDSASRAPGSHEFASDESVSDEPVSDEPVSGEPVSGQQSLRLRLRSLDAFPIVPGDFDAATVPKNPYDLMATWLDGAISSGVSQPHAMVLSTVDGDGRPDARTLLLKDVTSDQRDRAPGSDSGAGRTDGFWFASMSDGPKGEQLVENPAAALTLYWREQARQVRVRGQVFEGPREVSEADFRARSPQARAAALTGEQSKPLPGADAVRRQLAAAQEFVAGNPLFVPRAWTAYRLQPEEIEFWQTTAAREQVRVRYSRTASSWEHASLWH